MLCLAITCSTNFGSVALVDSHQLLFEKTWARQKSHGQLVNLAIDEAFKTSGKKLNQIDIIAVDNGPGSFTGIRVAVSIAKALGYSLQKPILAYTSLQIIAEAQSDSHLPILVMLDGQKNKVYAALFAPQDTKLITKIEPCVFTAEELGAKINAPTLCLGEGYDLLKDLLPKSVLAHFQRPNLDSNPAIDHPSAAVLARLAIRDIDSKPTLDWKLLDTLYIRASTAEEKLRNNT